MKSTYHAVIKLFNMTTAMVARMKALRIRMDGKLRSIPPWKILALIANASMRAYL